MLDELFPEDKRRLHELEMSLSQLERGNAFINVSDISLAVYEMESRLETLDKLVNKESKTRRNEMKRKLDHLRSTYNHVKVSLENYKKRNYTQNYNQQRQELFANNGSSRNDNFDIEMAESGSINNSDRKSVV